MKDKEINNGMETSYIGTQLRRRRVQLNMTQQELADKLGVTKGGLSAYEQDKIRPSGDKLVKLAKILGVPVEYFLETDAEPVPMAQKNDKRIGRISDRQVGIGRQIASLRQERGMSCHELASKINITDGTLSRFERDLVSPSYETLIEMAKLFDVSTESLFGINSGKTLDISGLTEEYKRVVREIVRNMR